MLKQTEQAQQRWGGEHEAVDRWLHERQQLLVRYFQLAGLPPYSTDQQQLPSAESIRDFCELLMDYVSAGHFEVYDHIVRADSEHTEHMLKLADEVYPKIADSTDLALNFNDQFGDACDQTDYSKFDRQLSQLGEALELRMEYEDQLLQNLFTTVS